MSADDLFSDAVRGLDFADESEQLILEVPPPTNPMQVAREFTRLRFTDDTTKLALLSHHGGLFFRYAGTHWPELDDRALRAALYGWLEHAQYLKPATDTKPAELVDFEPNSYKVRNIVEALAAAVHVDGSLTAPFWLDGRDDAPGFVALRNGILHMPTRALTEHTPAFFSHHALGFDFDPDAEPPRRWLSFLDELWPDDHETAACLAEVMGYVLAGDTSLQKVFLIVGPKRSGKGTIARVLTGLLGAHNVAAPTLSSLTTNFGMQPLIGKPLAAISDARLSSRSDSSIAVERLLSISGEDSLTVDRKYRDPWTGRLPTRFLLMTNEIPKFADASGALASRFVVLTMTNSFYDREDPTLTDALLAEAPGIFNWCLEGLDRLNERGHFDVPGSSREALRQLEDLSAPVSAFVRDRCSVGVALEVEKNDLYSEWRSWCEAEGRARASTKAVFFRDLYAAFPSVREARPRDGQKRTRVVEGIALGERSPTPRTTPDLADGVEVRSGVDDGQKRWSEGLVQGSPGSSASSSPLDVEEVIRRERHHGIDDRSIAALMNAQPASFPSPPHGFARWTGHAVRVAIGEAEGDRKETP